jgi:predicted molibdopterin-dependent oxidoreductase YjgC
MMGACHDCLVVADGVANVQACMTEVRQGMKIGRQHGARDPDPDTAPRRSPAR